MGEIIYITNREDEYNKFKREISSNISLENVNMLGVPVSYIKN